jgi:hypothetical protein
MPLRVQLDKVDLSEQVINFPYLFLQPI